MKFTTLFYSGPANRQRWITQLRQETIPGRFSGSKILAEAAFLSKAEALAKEAEYKVRL